MRRTDGPWPVWEILPGRLYQRGKLHPRFDVDQKVRGLTYYGITHAVALAPPQPDPDLVDFDDVGLFGYTHFPIPDGRLKTGAQMIELAHELVMEEGCVLTMCNAGRNRSGLLSALIVRELRCVTGSEALDYVRHHRPEALANEHFEAFLRSLP